MRETLPIDESVSHKGVYSAIGCPIAACFETDSVPINEQR